MHPENSGYTDWLMWFTKVGHEAVRNYGTRPFLLPDGRRAATNGYLIVATTETAPQGPWPSPSPSGSLPNTSQGFFSLPVINEATLTPSDMAAVFGAVEEPRVRWCPECDGTGEVDHDCGCHLCDEDTEECEACDGTGKVETIPEKRTVRCWGQHVDANLIAYVIAHAPAAERYTVRKTQGGISTNYIHVVTDTWHAVVCGMEGRSIEAPDESPEVMEKATAGATS